MTAAQRQHLVQQLNKDCEDNHKKNTEALFFKSAAHLFRSRVVVFESAENAKRWMESSQAGLKMRVAILDVSMPPSLQTSHRSRQISLKPNEAQQDGWAKDIKLLPATPVLGHVLIRACYHDLHHLCLAELDHRLTA